MTPTATPDACSRILAHLRQTGQRLTAAELTEAVGCTRATVYNTLSALLLNGDVRRSAEKQTVPRGVWSGGPKHTPWRAVTVYWAEGVKS
jgi:predicted transcriptional regulator